VKRTNINTPHNNFFIQVLSIKEKAIAFFAKYLPKLILEIANLNQIEIVESKHMSNAGHSLYNDILYKCPLGKDQVGYFFLMCEHQSTPDPHMPLRLAGYNLATIKDHLKQGHDKFPIVINTVFYTGKRPWKYSTAFSDYYANSSLGSQYLYMAPFTLVKLPTDVREEIYRDKDLGFCFAAFYSGREKDAYLEFEKFKEIPAFQHYLNTLSKEEKVLVARYITWCLDSAGNSLATRYNLEKVVDLLITNQKEKEALMRSVAQEYIDKGIQQGIQQGMQQGILVKAEEVAKNMLFKLNLDLDTVQQVTGLTKEYLKRIKKN
jgi:recombination-promoting nuclease RpnB